MLNYYEPNHVNSIIDNTNSFISINLKSKIVIEWKDSYRIFPFSLNELCNLFNIQGKLMSYDLRFNKIELFNSPTLINKFKQYALQDAISLFEALFYAQFIYFDKFKIDIESVYSTATLNLKIFKTSFFLFKIYSS